MCIPLGLNAVGFWLKLTKHLIFIEFHAIVDVDLCVCVFVSLHVCDNNINKINIQHGDNCH